MRASASVTSGFDVENSVCTEHIRWTKARERFYLLVAGGSGSDADLLTIARLKETNYQNIPK